MFHLKNELGNVHFEVKTEAEKLELEKRGFKVVETPEEVETPKEPKAPKEKKADK